MFQLDLKSRVSIHDQVVNNFKELIISEILHPDEKLPSVRDLAKTLTINPNTIQKAYTKLEAQGYIYTVSGLGSFVAIPEDIAIDIPKLNGIKNSIRVSVKELFYMGLSRNEMIAFFDEMLENWKEERKL